MTVITVRRDRCAKNGGKSETLLFTEPLMRKADLERRDIREPKERELRDDELAFVTGGRGKYQLRLSEARSLLAQH